MTVEKFKINIKNSYPLEQSEQVIQILNYVNAINFEDPIYNSEFSIEVASSVLNNKLDYKSVIVGLLYPIVKLNKLDEIKGHNLDFEIYEMLSSLSLIEKTNLTTKQEQLDSVKKMFIGLAKDIRVVIIKLCAEELKLKYLDKMTPEKVEALMKSYTDLYSPISAMLGMSQIKNKLENATFKYYKPKMYEELSDALNKYVEERNGQIQDVIEKIKTELKPIIKGDYLVYGRQKQLASIAKKLQKKNMTISTILDIYGRKNNIEELTEHKSFNEITLSHILDILAVRVIVNTVEECYTVLGKIFSIFKPFGNFKDYISHPKENGYQSLHTAIILDNGDPVEVQIRTFEMHQYAEYGLAAHWAYKENRKVNESDIKINYIRSILEMYKEKSADELLDILKTDVYVGNIFVQSPMGKILEFPEGSTPIDFAYAIHSKIGNTCVGAKINGKMVPLSTMLYNGDIVEIITNPNSKGPSRDWLKLCKTSGARSKINAFFRKEMKEDNIRKGKSMLESQAKLKNMNLSKLMIPEFLEEVFDKYSLASLDDLYASIGYGGLNTTQILNKLKNLYNDKIKQEKITEKNDKQYKNVNSEGKVFVRGFSKLLTKFAKCCNPVPGDDIVGYVSRGKGVTIHRADCPSINNYEFDRLIECEWNDCSGNSFIGSINVICSNKSTTIPLISKKLGDNKIQVAHISSKTISDNKLLITIQVYISKKEEINEIIQKLLSVQDVFEAFRAV